MDPAHGTIDDPAGAAFTAGRRARTITFDELGVPSVFAAYAAGDARALRFFAGDPHAPADRLAAAMRAVAHPRDRGALADVLEEQNNEWAAPEADATASVQAGIEALRDPSSVAVVTGQQLGLFGGPLYTIHKALTAVAFARRFAEENGRPAVPVFWLADEDHDFAEVRTAAFATGAGVGRVAYHDGRPAEANRGPVGRIALGESINRTVDELEASLPAGQFTPALLAALRDAWRPGERWRDAFARTMRVLLPEAPLVYISADDPRIKTLAGEILRGEVADWRRTHAVHAAGTDDVVASAFGVQVDPRPLHLFLLDDGRRLALDPSDDAPETDFTVRMTGERLAADALKSIAAGAPVRLSPDVVLRPVIQDALLPTVAYVGGPGETAYFAQLRGVYERFGVPMPLVVPRASLTLVEPAVRRIVNQLGVDVTELRGDPAGLLTRLALARDAPDLGDALAGAARDAEGALAAASAAVTALDSSLASAAGAALARTRKALDGLRRKAERVARRRHDDDAARIARARAALFPESGLQERVLSALGLYGRYGRALGWLVEGAIDLDARDHAVVDLP